MNINTMKKSELIDAYKASVISYDNKVKEYEELKTRHKDLKADVEGTLKELKEWKDKYAIIMVNFNQYKSDATKRMLDDEKTISELKNRIKQYKHNDIFLYVCGGILALFILAYTFICLL